MLPNAFTHPSSYRDPSGFVFEKGGILYRQVNKIFKDHYDHFIESGCYKKLVEKEISDLNAREENLKKELAELESRRTELAGSVDESFRGRYERLLKNKGENVIVGVQHGVCGGCHMKLPAQIIVQCRTAQELTTCTNCGRILYYTRDMDLAVAD